jgi:hypothetical protein
MFWVLLAHHQEAPTNGTWCYVSWLHHQLYAPAAFTPLPGKSVNIPITLSCHRLSQFQGHSAAGRIMSMEWNIPMTPSGNEPATFRFVARCLNQLRLRKVFRGWIQKCLLWFIFKIRQDGIYNTCAIKKNNLHILHSIIFWYETHFGESLRKCLLNSVRCCEAWVFDFRLLHYADLFL